jgi:hypothetical protein
MEGGELLAKGEVLKGGLGTGAESRAQGGEQVQEEGEHRQLAHDATGRMPHLRIPEFTDGRTVSRMNTWRRTQGGMCNGSPKPPSARPPWACDCVDWWA